MSVKEVLENSNLILFFRHKGEIYGAPESSRLTFAKLKDRDDEDNTPAWRKEANFSAVNLRKVLEGEKNESIFGDKDLDEIKVVDKKEVEKSLNK